MEYCGYHPGSHWPFKVYSVLASGLIAMPVINFDYSDFLRIYGASLDQEDFLDRVPLIGADVDKVEGTQLAVEFFPDRPDLFSVEGIARAMRAFLDQTPGLKVYTVAKPSMELTVEPSVLEVRPFVACAVVRGVELDEQAIIALMELQEKLHLTLGRKRSKVSIGVHDLDPLTPPFRYLAVGPHDISFVPLQMRREMDLEEILTDHPKGQDYAHLMEGHDKYPLIVDAHQQVLSFPPIINGTLTTVTEDTSNILLDVTGLDRNAVELTLNIVACALVERGGELEGVTLHFPKHKVLDGLSKKSRTYPNLAPDTWKVEHDYLQGLLGWEITADDLDQAFQRMGLGAKITKANTMEISVPRYRSDILHQVDLVEEAAIGLGYQKAPQTLPKSMSFGSRRKTQERAEAARRALVELGFQEIMTLSLSGPKAQYQNQGQEEPKGSGPTRLANPIGQEYSQLRERLMPGLLEVLAANTHRELPQRLAEVGEVVINHRNVHRLAFVVLESRANFTRAKGQAEALLKKLGIEYTLEPGEAPGFISGRCAKVRCEDDIIGHFGEMAPKTILNWELTHPLIAGEFELR